MCEICAVHTQVIILNGQKFCLIRPGEWASEIVSGKAGKRDEGEWVNETGVHRWTNGRLLGEQGTWVTGETDRYPNEWTGWVDGRQTGASRGGDATRTTTADRRAHALSAGATDLWAGEQAYPGGSIAGWAGKWAGVRESVRVTGTRMSGWVRTSQSTNARREVGERVGTRAGGQKRYNSYLHLRQRLTLLYIPLLCMASIYVVLACINIWMCA